MNTEKSCLDQRKTILVPFLPIRLGLCASYFKTERDTLVFVVFAKPHYSRESCGTSTTFTSRETTVGVRTRAEIPENNAPRSTTIIYKTITNSIPSINGRSLRSKVGPHTCGNSGVRRV